MARAPYAKVSKTSGQGVSRLSYQSGYRTGNKGTGSPGGGKDTPSVRSSSSSSSSSKPPKSGGGKMKFDKGGNLNISYGNDIFLSDKLKDEPAGKTKTPGFLKLGKPVKYKERKGDSGWLKGKK
jgi:hypothetical protein